MKNQQKKRKNPGEHPPQQGVFAPGKGQLEPDRSRQTEKQQQENHFTHSVPRIYLNLIPHL